MLSFKEKPVLLVKFRDISTKVQGKIENKTVCNYIYSYFNYYVHTRLCLTE